MLTLLMTICLSVAKLANALCVCLYMYYVFNCYSSNCGTISSSLAQTLMSDLKGSPRSLTLLLRSTHHNLFFLIVKIKRKTCLLPNSINFYYKIGFDDVESIKKRMDKLLISMQNIIHKCKKKNLGYCTYYSYSFFIIQIKEIRDSQGN